MIPKFRAWDERAGLTEVVSIDFVEKKLKVSHWEYGVSNYFPLDDVELMRSTGLKDKNGVEIFEGDVVVGQQHLTTDLSTPFEIKGLVRYSKRNTMFYLDEKSFGHDKFMHSLGSSIYQFEVIGNVFANPELLEVEG